MQPQSGSHSQDEPTVGARVFPLQMHRYLTVLAVITLLGVCALVLRAGQVKESEGEYPRAFLVVFWAYVSVFVALLLVMKVNARWPGETESAIHWLNKTGLSGVVAYVCFATALLLYQFERWMLPGSKLLAVSGALGTATFMCLCAHSGFTSFSWCRSLRDRAADAAGRALSYVRKLPALFGVIIVARTATAGYYAGYTPLMCDESATYWLFARSPLDALIRYDVPNNHILHSLAVSLTTAAFGSDEFAIRLPAALSSAAGLLALYALANALCDRYVALLASAIGAGSLWLFFYSFQARGYAFVALLSPWIVGSLALTFTRPRSQLPWVGFVLAMSLSFATLPTTIYLWISCLAFGAGILTCGKRITGTSRVRWVVQLFLALGVILVVAGFWYLNPFFFLFTTGRLRDLSFSFVDQPQSIIELSGDVVSNALFNGAEFIDPPRGWHLTGLLLLAGIIFSIVMLVLRRRWCVLFALACLCLAPIPMLAVQDNLPFARNFFYLLPLLYIVAAHGLVEGGRALGSAIMRWSSVRRGVVAPDALCRATAVMLFVGTFYQGQVSMSSYVSRYTSLEWPAQGIAQLIQTTARPEDGIVADTCLEYMIPYYLAPQFHVTSILEWWSGNKPTAARLYVIPARGDFDPSGRKGEEFLKRACEGRGGAVVVGEVGQQTVYRCERGVEAQ